MPRRIADIIETVFDEATSEREEGARRRLDDLHASMQERLTRLLDASPAVIYSFKARDDYGPIFVSGNIERLLGYSPDEYLKNADFWRERVPRRTGRYRSRADQTLRKRPTHHRIP